MSIPDWVVDLASFRLWVHSTEVPEKVRTCYLAGEIYVDLSREQIFSHNQVKQQFNVVIGRLVKASETGLYFPDGVLFSNIQADLASQPDGMFVGHESFDRGRIALVEDADGGCSECEGSPDVVIEVVSDGSERKDKTFLRDLYWRAGIREYWLADARKAPLSFEIMHSTEQGFVTVAGENGWHRSNVFERTFRLCEETDELGYPDCLLEIR